MPNLLLRGNTLGDISGVLFDKDGTLSNSETYLLYIAKLRIEEASRILLKRGVDKNKIAEVNSLLISCYGINKNRVNPNGIIAIASKEKNLISTATVITIIGKSWPFAYELAHEIFSAVDLKIENPSTKNKISRSLLPGALDMLTKLKNSGISCAVISNDNKKGIKDFLIKNKLEKVITKYWSAEHLPPKPDPDAVKGLCNEIQLKPSECALIGDADSDLKMARRAGIGITLGYTSGWSMPAELNFHQHLINHWDELNIQSTPKIKTNFDLS